MSQWPQLILSQSTVLQVFVWLWEVHRQQLIPDLKYLYSVSMMKRRYQEMSARTMALDGNQMTFLSVTLENTVGGWDLIRLQVNNVTVLECFSTQC